MRTPPAMGRSRSFRYMAGQQGNLFVRLMHVDITHNFYTQQGGRCTDFSVIPTAATSPLLASLGLIFKDEGAGFSIFIQPGNLDNLIAYLQREAITTDAGPQYWSRLTFLLLLGNPTFVGITALPIETRSSDSNLYGSNRTAHRGGDGTVLPTGDFLGADALYPTVGTEVPLALPENAHSVTVTDIAGSVVIPAPGGDPVVITDTGIGALPKRATLDFTPLAHDLYTINATTKRGKPVRLGGYPRTVLYVPTASESMVLLDLLFTRPTPDADGIYPIPSLFGLEDAPDAPPLGQDGDYRLPFDARKTWWQYYVVSQTPLGALTELRIQGPGTQFKQAADPVRLPDGNEAILFTSDAALPLRQKSGQHFRLNGQRRDAGGHENAIHITRLPVAPAAPVWPAPKGDSMSGASEMFVYV